MLIFQPNFFQHISVHAKTICFPFSSGLSMFSCSPSISVRLALPGHQGTERHCTRLLDHHQHLSHNHHQDNVDDSDIRMVTIIYLTFAILATQDVGGKFPHLMRTHLWGRVYFPSDPNLWIILGQNLEKKGKKWPKVPKFMSDDHNKTRFESKIFDTWAKDFFLF